MGQEARPQPGRSLSRTDTGLPIPDLAPGLGDLWDEAAPKISRPFPTPHGEVGWGGGRGGDASANLPRSLNSQVQ